MKLLDNFGMEFEQHSVVPIRTWDDLECRGQTHAMVKGWSFFRNPVVSVIRTIPSTTFFACEFVKKQPIAIALGDNLFIVLASVNECWPNLATTSSRESPEL